MPLFSVRVWPVQLKVSAIWSVAPTMLTLTAPPNTMLLLVRILVPLRALEAKVKGWVAVNVPKFVKLSEP